MTFGLAQDDIDSIRRVLKTEPEIKEAHIFGSRAKNIHREGSDIDIVLFGSTIAHKSLLQLQVRLDELDLPYTFDIIIYSNIDEPDLKKHIERVGVPFYKNSSSTPST